MLKNLTLLTVLICICKVYGTDIPSLSKKNEINQLLIKTFSGIDEVIDAYITDSSKNLSSKKLYRNNIKQYTDIIPIIAESLEIKAKKDLDSMNNYYEKEMSNKAREYKELLGKKIIDSTTVSIIVGLKDTLTILGKKQFKDSIAMQNITNLCKLKSDTIFKQDSILHDSIAKQTAYIFALKQDSAITKARLETYQKPYRLFGVGFGVGLSNISENDKIRSSGMISAMLTIRHPLGKTLDSLEQSNKLLYFKSGKILINIPLNEFAKSSGGDLKQTGLFNKEMAVGLGWGIDIIKQTSTFQEVTLFTTVNINEKRNWFAFTGIMTSIL